MNRGPYLKIILLFLSVQLIYCRPGADSLQTMPDTLYPQYGIFTDFNMSYHFVDFRAFPGVPSCCPKYNNGIGDGVSAGLFYEFPINPLMSIHLRGGIDHIHGYLSRDESEDVVVDSVITEGIFSHQASFWLTNAVFRPMFYYKLAPNLNATGNISFSYNLNSHYNQIERITRPSDRGTFIDGRRFRNDSSGAIKNINPFNFGIGVGLNYLLPLNEKGTLFLAPEVNVNYNFLPVVSEYSWNYMNVNAGIAIVFRKPPPPPPPPPPPEKPPYPGLEKPSAPPFLTVDVEAYELAENGSEKDDFSVGVEDFVSLNMRPLLNYVFFDEGSAVIPARYVKLNNEPAQSFNANNLKNFNALETYYYVLNIIGQRLRENPDVNITLVGTNSNEGIEKNNIELSRNRAEAVKDYFSRVWNIDSGRMKIEARNLPRQANSSDEPGADEENRRVEILSDSPVLSQPVFTSDTLRVVTSKTVRFKLDINSNKTIDEWMLEITQQDSILKSYSSSRPDENVIDWEIPSKGPGSPRYTGPIEYKLSARNSIGMDKEITKTIPIKRLTIDRKRLENISDREFEYYSLILFDFGSAKLEKAHRQVIDFVKNRITDGAKVFIYGYSDSMGEEESNLRLSKRRAEAVAERLQIDNATVEAVGEGDLLYSNDYPEGRFYCRTVTITIETPISNK